MNVLFFIERLTEEFIHVLQQPLLPGVLWVMS